MSLSLSTVLLTLGALGGLTMSPLFLDFNNTVTNDPTRALVSFAFIQLFASVVLFTAHTKTYIRDVYIKSHNKTQYSDNDDSNNSNNNSNNNIVPFRLVFLNFHAHKLKFSLSVLVIRLLTTTVVVSMGLTCVFIGTGAEVINAKGVAICRVERKGGPYVSKMKLKPPEPVGRQVP